MVTTLLRATACTALMLSSALAVAAPAPFSCPAELGPTDQKALQPPAEWTAAMEAPGATRHPLVGFTINLGPVSKSDGAIYDDLKEKKDPKGGVTETATWKVSALEDAYAVCAYHRTAVVLVRPLKGYSQCQLVNTRTRDTSFRMKEAGCQ